jgi:hypothetical protein
MAVPSFTQFYVVRGSPHPCGVVPWQQRAKCVLNNLDLKKAVVLTSAHHPYSSMQAEDLQSINRMRKRITLANAKVAPVHGYTGLLLTPPKFKL